MKSLILIVLALPLLVFSQKKAATKPMLKAGAATGKKAFDEFLIQGNVTGFKDGTDVSFLNEQTSMPEKQTTIQNGKFTIKGKMEQPGFKGLIFGDVQRLVPIFLDNSNVKISGDKSTLDQLVITGSPSHAQFSEYSNAIKPYTKVFVPDTGYDSSAVTMVKKISEDFVKKYPSSYVAPLAIIRLYQASEDGVKADELFSLLSDKIKTSALGNYVNQQIQESKINALGTPVADFTQNDTAGKPVSISSLRGKYVLIDFWASWCRPCRMENPNVVAAFTKYKGKNFTVLGVSLDQAKDAWLNAIQMDNLAWNHVSDLKGWGNAVAAQLQVRSIPQNLLVDPQGKIIAKNLRGTMLDKKLEAVLK